MIQSKESMKDVAPPFYHPLSPFAKAFDAGRNRKGLVDEKGKLELAKGLHLCHIYSIDNTVYMRSKASDRKVAGLDSAEDDGCY
jgi:hypothetical protein